MVRRAVKSRKPRRRVAGKRVARKGKKGSKVTQYATITETIALPTLSPNVTVAYGFNLSQFRRASVLAPSFKWYKAAKVTYTMEPLYNTFQDGVTGNEVSAPYLYQLMNRTQDSRPKSLVDLQACGVKPQKFTSKKVITYTPNWCSPGLTTFTKTLDGVFTGGTNQGLKAQYSYLACPDDSNKAPDIGQGIVPLDPRALDLTVQTGMYTINANQVEYNGHLIYLDQLVPTGDDQPCCRIVATVTWLFKDPNFSAFIRDPEPVKAIEV